MSDKGVSLAMESEPGKECIEMEEIGKLENSGMYCLTKVNMLCGNMSQLVFPRTTWKSGFLEIRFSGNPVFQKVIAPERRCSGILLLRVLSPLHLPLTLIILGPFQVSVQMEQDEPKNEIAPASTSDKEVGKNESSGKGNRK